ncbi:MAG: GldG family protein [Opitutales bacterium]
MLPSLEEFSVARWAKGLNRAVQVVLSLTLVAGLNYMAAQHFERYDLTANHRFSLSAETLAYLTNSYLKENSQVTAEEPIELILTLPSSQPDEKSAQQIAAIFGDMRELMREYENAAQGAPGGPVPLKTEVVDTFKQTLRTEQLTHEGLQPDTVMLVRQGVRSRSLTLSDLYEIQNGEPKAFMGESAITAAILDVIQSQPKKIYFVRGHGEMLINDTNPQEGLSELKEALRVRNFSLSELDLTTGQGVPDDAALVVIPGPKFPFQPYEVDKLRAYLSQPHGRDQTGGRVIALLDPERANGLDDLLYNWGILSDDAVVIDPDASTEDLQGDIIIGSYREHPITQFLGQNQLGVRFGPTRPVRADLGAPIDNNRQVTDELLLTSNASWAERGYRQGDDKYTKGVDLPGPVSVAALAEERPPGILGLAGSGGRLMVFGNADFIANSHFDVPGNTYLFMNTVNYLLDRKNVLNIPPKPSFQFQLNLSQENLAGLAWRLAVPPALLALLGLLVYVARRR